MAALTFDLDLGNFIYDVIIWGIPRESPVLARDLTWLIYLIDLYVI
jgi:hypothetical protein